MSFLSIFNQEPRATWHAGVSFCGYPSKRLFLTADTFSMHGCELRRSSTFCDLFSSHSHGDYALSHSLSRDAACRIHPGRGREGAACEEGRGEEGVLRCSGGKEVKGTARDTNLRVIRRAIQPTRQSPVLRPPYALIDHRRAPSRPLLRHRSPSSLR